MQSDIPRVGIFQANWPMQPLTFNAIKEFVRYGYAVDIFIFNVSEELYSLEENIEPEIKNIRILKLNKIPDEGMEIVQGIKEVKNNEDPAGQVKRKSLPYLLKNYLYTWKENLLSSIKLAFCVNDLNILNPNIYNQAFLSMEGYSYKALIGIERYGLAWAGFVSRQLKIPLLYWSYELYTTDHPRFQNDREFQRSKRVERKYYRRAKATIIQDEDRAAVLFKDNHTKADDLLLVPVSLLGSPITEKSQYLHNLLNIPSGKKIILSLGVIAPWRLSEEIIKAAQVFPEDWVMVLHGPCYDKEFQNNLELSNPNKRVIISLKHIPSKEIDDLVSSADVGLVYYSNRNANDLLTAKSSYKVAQYAKAGIPMVVNDYPSFQKVLEKYQFGRSIKTMDEMTSALEIIFNEYDEYRKNALNAYTAIYEFSNQFSKVIDWISRGIL